MSCTGCGFKDIAQESAHKTMHVEDSIQNSCNPLNEYDWMNDIPDTGRETDLVEIRFKNTRKEFYKNKSKLQIKRGDLVLVEGTPGSDVGIVSLKGILAEKQYKRRVKDPTRYTIRNLLRKASKIDIDRWSKAKEREKPVMIEARKIAQHLNLDMKIGDVEFQGDGKKAIFYYVADDRVDFRELIKRYAKTFMIRVEMKQIGARQEAGRIGGIGSCGRELCCSSWRTELGSVSIDAAKYQDLPLNAQKLAGQCGKLKCCLMYEFESYLESWEEFPSELLELETEAGTAYRYKIEVLKKIIWYSFDKDAPLNLVPVGLDRVKEVIQLNKRGEKVKQL